MIRKEKTIHRGFLSGFRLWAPVLRQDDEGRFEGELEGRV